MSGFTGLSIVKILIILCDIVWLLNFLYIPVIKVPFQLVLIDFCESVQSVCFSDSVLKPWFNNLFQGNMIFFPIISIPGLDCNLCNVINPVSCCSHSGPLVCCRLISRWPSPARGRIAFLKCPFAGWPRCRGGCCRRRWSADVCRSRWTLCKPSTWPWDTWPPWGTLGTDWQVTDKH